MKIEYYYRAITIDGESAVTEACGCGGRMELFLRYGSWCCRCSDCGSELETFAQDPWEAVYEWNDTRQAS